MRIAALFSAVGLTAMTTGCATITGGTTQNLSVRTQKDSVDVVGATCVLTNSEGEYQTVTPGKVSVHRAKDDLSIQCTKDGETSQVVQAKSLYRKGALVGDILNAGVVGLVMYGVDRASGSIFYYPDDVMVSFGESTGNAQGTATPASIPTASTAPADSAQVQTTADTNKTQ